MRSRTFAPRLVLTATLVAAIATHAAVLTSAGEGEQGVPVREAAHLSAPAPPATAKPGPAPPAAKPAASTGVIFRDDFTKPSLDPPWKVEQEDKDRWAIGGGELAIITQPRVKAATSDGESVLKNRIVLDRDLPPDFTITARLNVAIVRNGNTVGFRVRTPDGNYVIIGFTGVECCFGERYRRVILGKEINRQYAQLSSSGVWDQGKPTQISLDSLPRTTDQLWLRLEKQGFTFIGSYSFDGTRFEAVGQQLMVRSDGARLELVAYDERAGAEAGARFDSIEITR